ncbi:MAG: hypothetical protein K8S54_16375 [Spirochaetia bacterium]|nr:hypothetical protein [Spirochaetia bacterium]
MAEEKIELTPEETAQVQSLLEPLAQGSPAFFPMSDQFKSDMQEVEKILAVDEEPEPGAESAPPEVAETPEAADITAPPADAGDASDFSFDSDPLPDMDTGTEASADAADPFATPAGGDDFAFDDTPTLQEPALPETQQSDLADTGASSDTDFPPDNFADPSFETTEPPTEDFGAPDDGLSLETDPFATPSGESAPSFDLETPSDAAEGGGFDFDTPATADAGGTDDAAGDPFGGGDDFANTDAAFEDAIGISDSTPMETSDFGDDSGGGFADLAPAASDFGDSGLSDADFAPTAGADMPDATATATDAPGDFGDFSNDLSGLQDDFSSSPDAGSGSAADLLDSSELADMTKQANLAQGIGDDFSDEDLAKIRTALDDIPPALKKAIVNAIVEEKISRPDQQLVMHMLIDQANPESIADFLEPRIGYRPDLTPPQFRKDGIQIIYADGMSPEELAGRRKKARFTLFAVLGGLVGVSFLFGTLLLYKRFSISGTYKEGLKELALASITAGNEKEEHKKRAEMFYQKALSDSGTFDADMMNRYGLAMLRAGFYDDAFTKLFGKVDPAYDWTDPGSRAPLIRLRDGGKFPSPAEFAKGGTVDFLDRENTRRRLEIPGAYTVTRLRDGKLDKQTILSLGKFHSHSAQSFTKRAEGQKYKNDELGIDYYRLILTLMEMPDDIDARAGIGEVYYNKKEFTSAAREYNKILEKFPGEIKGHAGLLNTYIEVWRENEDPRYVIGRHRLIQSLGIEKDMPIYLLTKLAGFYIDLNEDDLRIRYQVDPVNAVNGMTIDDNATHLLEVVFNKTEERDGEVIEGASYGEGFYQRGRFLTRQKESLRALRQFQNAHQYDPRHYLAVREMGAYYRGNLDFTKAEEYFKKSLELHNQFKDEYGARPEDETLIAGDVGLMYYDLGSLLFLRYAGSPRENKEAFADTRIYPDRGTATETSETQKRRELLTQARDYFDEALKQKVRDPRAKVEAIYWSGWIDYTSADFESALQQWEDLQDIFAGNYSDPVLLMARANSYYYTDQTRSALGDYLKIQDDLERKLAMLDHAVPEDPEHQKLFLTLAALYNNLGAVYEKEFNEGTQRGASRRSLQDLEKNSLKYYWKSIESARKVDEDNEIARANLQLAFRPGMRKKDPILDDWISPMLPTLSEKKK